MKAKKIPMRMCLGCREMKPKKELIRIVRGQDGTVKADATGKLPGRGAYICPKKECLAACINSKAINRAFEIQLTPQACSELAKELEQLEAEKQAALAAAAKAELPAPQDEEKTVFTQRDLCQFEDFEKIQLVVAKVLKCEKVPKADKLLMSTLKVGDTERVVVSGIAKFYTPE